MKRVLLMAVSITASINSFALVTQGNWRWRHDDGSETTATWMANQNVAPVISSSSEKLRLRIELYNNNTDPSDVATSTLQDSLDGGTGWQDITSTVGTNAFILAGTSLNVIDGEATTQQLSGVDVSYIFDPGKIIVSSNSLSTDVVDSAHETEYEWVIQPTVNILPNKTYLFRVDPVNVDTIATPSLTTAAVLPVSFTNFSVSPDDKRVKLQWTTATEQNNDHFVIERSTNGNTNWQLVTTVKGSGSTTQSHTYTVHDNTPLNGKNFYRIKQYDADGNWKESEIKLLTMQEVNSLLTIFPNPVRGNINFTLSNYKGNLTTTLTDLKGKIVHKEIISADANIGSYKLNLKNALAAGMYILQLKGEGLAASSKVVVQ